MLRGLYSLASAMDVAATNHEVVAANLAHSNTPGYCRQAIPFESFDPPSPMGTASQPYNPIISVRSGGAYTNFESGPLQQTGNPLDVAVSGDGFFVFQGPRGPLYSRNGGFELGGGQLRTRSGLPVMAGGSPLTIPENASDIRIAQDGTVSADGTTLGTLDVVTFDRPETLRRAGDTTFEGGTPQTPAPGAVRVAQGFREGSNVNVVSEMVSMMLGMRHYEAAEKTMRAMSDAIAQQTRPQ
jgi:flagellar basal body rod protein FlgG